LGSRQIENVFNWKGKGTTGKKGIGLGRGEKRRRQSSQGGTVWKKGPRSEEKGERPLDANRLGGKKYSAEEKGKKF